MTPVPDRENVKTDDDGWSHWEDEDEDNYPADNAGGAAADSKVILNLPAQLHPAVSLGMRRMSSCYLSITESERNNSMTDLLSLLEENTPNRSASDVLYHDILMHVFGFLEETDLKAFSQVSRHSNFECFYFLQLKLQQALLAFDDTNENNNSSNTQKPLTRLATLDRPAAERLVQTYLESNSTLSPTMPLSHSLAYMRQWLMQRHSSSYYIPNDHNNTTTTAAQAAALVVLLGAAASSLWQSETLWRVGFVGSLMGAARTMSDEKERQALKQSMQQALQQHSQIVEQMERVLPPPFAQMLQEQLLVPTPNEDDDDDGGDETTKSNHDDGDGEDNDTNQQEEEQEDNRKVPSDCVGAYSRVVAQARRQVQQIVKDQRQRAFDALPAEQQQQLAREFLDACASDETVEHLRNSPVPVDGFYVGSDGTMTCALHTSAFHGASAVVEALCCCSEEGDGGLMADVNRTDDNGWTALHYAAGANAVEAARVLCRAGARWQVEASNGYTPLQWALRLKNMEVAEELEKWMLVAEPHTTSRSLARRFLALIPSPKVS